MSWRDEVKEWYEGGDGHGYVYQYIGPVHYLCECGESFLNREDWLAHKEAVRPVYCTTCAARFDDELALANHVLDYIAKHLSGVVWDAGTLNKVADELRATGRVIEEPS